MAGFPNFTIHTGSNGAAGIARDDHYRVFVLTTPAGGMSAGANGVSMGVRPDHKGTIIIDQTTDGQGRPLDPPSAPQPQSVGAAQAHAQAAVTGPALVPIAAPPEALRIRLNSVLRAMRASGYQDVRIEFGNGFVSGKTMPYDPVTGIKMKRSHVAFTDLGQLPPPGYYLSAYKSKHDWNTLVSLKQEELFKRVWEDYLGLNRVY